MPDKCAECGHELRPCEASQTIGTSPYHATRFGCLAERTRRIAEIASAELRSAQCSPAGLDHNGTALGEEIIKLIRREFPDAFAEIKEKKS